MSSQRKTVFVSYSHEDQALVDPIVKLLRANESRVFQDVDCIQPSKRWRREIAKALAEAELVIVFWCDHASRSNEVSEEWKTAIAQKKDLLPLLLDATPLPLALGEFQWIDFRGVVGASHSSMDWACAQEKSNPWAYGVGILAVLGIAGGLIMDTSDGPPEPSFPPGPFLPDLRWLLDVDSKILLLLNGVFVVIACLAWWLKPHLFLPRYTLSERVERVETAF